jgi:hypothetical protein
VLNKTKMAEEPIKRVKTKISSVVINTAFDVCVTREEKNIRIECDQPCLWITNGSELALSDEEGCQFTFGLSAVLGFGNWISFRGGIGNRVFVDGKEVTRDSGAAQTEKSKNAKTTCLIPLSDLSSISVTSSGTVQVDPSVLASRVSLSLTDSGTLNVKKTKNKRVFKRVTLNLVGSGDIKFSQKAEDVQVNLTGSGDVRGFVATQELSLNLTGSGDITGKRTKNAHVSKTVTGSGDIHLSKV